MNKFLTQLFNRISLTYFIIIQFNMDYLPNYKATFNSKKKPYIRYEIKVEY